MFLKEGGSFTLLVEFLKYFLVKVSVFERHCKGQKPSVELLMCAHNGANFYGESPILIGSSPLAKEPLNLRTMRVKRYYKSVLTYICSLVAQKHAKV